jgi:hypothetical protein
LTRIGVVSTGLVAINYVVLSKIGLKQKVKEMLGASVPNDKNLLLLTGPGKRPSQISATKDLRGSFSHYCLEPIHRLVNGSQARADNAIASLRKYCCVTLTSLEELQGYTTQIQSDVTSFSN